MEKKHEIISMDSKKVWFETSGNKKVCKKRTSQKEFESLIQASNFLENKKLNIFQREYKILTPNIVSWDNRKGILTMEFCEGENLEGIICDIQTRNFGVKILQQMMWFVLKEKFFWADFAPRNIIINEDNIYIMDFEKGIMDENTKLEEYLRLRVYREYSSFLLQEERGIDIDTIFTLRRNEENELIDVNTCSRRIVILARETGYYPVMTKKQSLDMRKKIIEAEKPYISHNHIVYPRIKIEKLLEDRSDQAYKVYSRFVLKNNDKKFEDGR